MSMQRLPGFTPQRVRATVNFAVSLTPARIQFDNIFNDGARSRHVRLWNGGGNVVFFELTGSDQNSDGDANAQMSIPLGPGESIILGTSGCSAVSAVTAIGNSLLYATPGEGH